jgi:hypothetical protein
VRCSERLLKFFASTELPVWIRCGFDTGLVTAAGMEADSLQDVLEINKRCCSNRPNVPAVIPPPSEATHPFEASQMIRFEVGGIPTTHASS